jgi:putative chitinase
MSFTDFELTEEKLAAILPGNKNISEWTSSLHLMLPKYDIVTANRAAQFIAQCAHESLYFTVLVENLNYRWVSLRRVFPKYFPTDNIAKTYAHQQAAIANRVYANRMGNRGENSGDGFLYRGRGLIQLTGKNNYSAFANYVNMELATVTDYATTFDGALESACWFWNTNNINMLADERNHRAVCRRINGGFNGLADRITKFDRSYSILTTAVRDA